MMLRVVSILYVLMVFSVAGYVYAPVDQNQSQLLINTPLSVTTTINDSRVDNSVSIVFVGDIMLGRNVETLIKKNGLWYPFQNVRSLLSSPDLTIGNFEGIVPETHVHTPDFTFRFSIKEEYLVQLKDAGFDILSLANNHSFDYGNTAFSYTRDSCIEIGLVCNGSPNQIDTHSTVIKEINGKKIGILFIHAVISRPEPISLERALNELQEKSDMQIAYIHWGEEYELTHSPFQEDLAYDLIDAGVDGIVGHHPHVIQDVDLYKGKPIFYSLVNFIFDQYFSQDVQEGLAISLEINNDTAVYSLVPFSSTSTHSQPQVMSTNDSERIFSRILEKIEGNIDVDLGKGILSVRNTSPD